MSERYQTILMFGPPGSGKGTQGKILGSIPGFHHCSCGDVFRRINPNSDLGQLFLQYSSRGELVPDDVTIRAWVENIHAQVTLSSFKPEEDVLILDGIPRDVHQARMLEEHIEVSKVINLTCSDEEKMIDRLRRRALKENRMDDAKEDVIRNRWQVYLAETAPVLDFYPSELIADIDALGSPSEVFLGVLSQVIDVQKDHYARMSAVKAG